MLNQQVAALVVLLVPAGRILQRDAADGHILAFAEVDVLRTVLPGRAVVFQRVLDLAFVDEAHHIVGHLDAPAVDDTLAGDGHIMLLDGEDE